MEAFKGNQEFESETKSFEWDLQVLCSKWSKHQHQSAIELLKFYISFENAKIINKILFLKILLLLLLIFCEGKWRIFWKIVEYFVKKLDFFQIKLTMYHFIAQNVPPRILECLQNYKILRNETHHKVHLLHIECNKNLVSLL
jgi:hypothetical protein